MKAMTYEGYSARVEYDPEDKLFVGHIAGINDVIGFHADNVADLEAAFRAAVDDYVETCRNVGKEPQRAYSGNILVRADPELHAVIAKIAELRGESMNDFAVTLLRDFATGLTPVAKSIKRAGVKKAANKEVAAKKAAAKKPANKEVAAKIAAKKAARKIKKRARGKLIAA